MSQNLRRLDSEYAFTLSVSLGQVVEIGETARGLRRVIPVIGGRLSGPRLTGTILPGGADYQVVRPDGVTELEAHYVVETELGLVYVDNRGLRVASAVNVERILRGEPVDPDQVYFRTTPQFEASAPELSWLSTTVFIASGARHPDSVEIDVFAVR